MRQQCAHALASRVMLLLCLVATFSVAATADWANGSEVRRTAIVKAVDGARWSVVNIHGQKLLPVDEHIPSQGSRAVNGMGTGVLIDQRGYLLTNFHVVDGVKRIQVTNAEGGTSVAKLIARDRATDLAVIKIPQDDLLHVVPLGTSHDLMVGETVIAMGNAYGYNHSVTRGIISALHRDVPISETQRYYDLIQTDAGINPGNSGGPLLNIDGKMIGLNVAVRVGAQNIGFAIPVDQALEVAADLIRQHQQESGQWHGVVGKMRQAGDHWLCEVATVEKDSPAVAAGIEAGDVITVVEGRPVRNLLDFEFAMLDRNVGEALTITTQRSDVEISAKLAVAKAPKDRKWGDVLTQAWHIAGLRLSPVDSLALPAGAKRYRGGLQVTAVRPGSPAEREHIQPGDILVGMHVWETVTLENVGYVFNQSEFDNNRPVKCYIVRDDRTHYAYLPVRVR
jgi:serine protease Do